LERDPRRSPAVRWTVVALLLILFASDALAGDGVLAHVFDNLVRNTSQAMTLASGAR
jgi:hypothetical protein